MALMRGAKNPNEAHRLASLLSKTNSKRKDLTTDAVEIALQLYDKDQLVGVLHHADWHEGVIGLVASRLVETHHRPMIAISRGETFSKGSVRSIPGFNIVQAIRDSSEFLVDAGGHPMAAGFTIETRHIEAFAKKINVYAQTTIKEETLIPVIDIECELSVADINKENLEIIKKFEPFGQTNPLPIFLTKGMLVEDVTTVGATAKHLKLVLSGISAIAFGKGDFRAKIRPGYNLDVAYTIAEDNYNGRDKLQLKIKDLKIAN
jgi:single-stranded-DNA-specific exonuclease